MKRKNIKRVFFLSTVFLILLNIFPLVSFAVSGSLAGTPLSGSSYMPVCFDYETSSVLPYGVDTHCVLYKTNDNSHYWYYFFDDSQQIADQSGSVTDYTILGFFIGFNSSNSNILTINIQSASKIICVHQYRNSNNVWVTDTSAIGSFISNTNYHIGFYQYQGDLQYYPDTGAKIIYSNTPYCWGGYSGDALLGAGVFGSISDFKLPYYICSYPDNVKSAIDSISDNTSLLNRYYVTINSKLNSLSSDHVALHNQLNELQSQVNSQGGEFQTALSQAQSEIESNANAAASNAASEINNAGEDISDIDNDVSDVNGIVSKCSEWVSDLDVFANRIEEAETGVASALENGKTLVNGFLGVSPPIVIALLTFCLCWFVVRKVIGR